MEIILVPTYQNQYQLSEYLGFLETEKYHVYDIFNTIRKGNQLIQADFLFASDKFIHPKSN